MLVANAQTNEVLTNQSIVQLCQLGLGEAVVINKIKTSKNTFDVSIDGLIQLKKENVPQAVISQMIESAQSNTKEIQQNSNDPLSEHSSGIYYYNTLNGELVQVYPTNSTASTTNTAAMAFTYGLAKAKTKTLVPGLKSRTTITQSKPVFYFYLPENDQNNLLSNSGFSVSSPNDFMIIQFELDEKKNSRSVESGSFNAYSRQQGVDNSRAIAFTYEKKKKGIYEVKVDQPLSAGEYAFMFTSQNVNKVYDFSIQVEYNISAPPAKADPPKVVVVETPVTTAPSKSVETTVNASTPAKADPPKVVVEEAPATIAPSKPVETTVNAPTPTPSFQVNDKVEFIHPVNNKTYNGFFKGVTADNKVTIMYMNKASGLFENVNVLPENVKHTSSN